MEAIQRKKFLKTLGALMLATSILPEFLFNRLSAASPPHHAIGLAPPLRKLTTSDKLNCGLIDLHFHTLKIYLWNRQMKYTHIPVPGDNFMRMQTDIHRVMKGHMKGFLATHHIPEKGWGQMPTLKKYYGVIKSIMPKLIPKVATNTPADFDLLKTNMAEVNSQLKNLSDHYHIVVAQNHTEFKNAIANNQIAVAHAVEGAHGLGSTLGDLSNYIRNLQWLKDNGVAMMTLSHFFENDISYPVEGMAPNEKQGMGWTWKYDPATMNNTLKTPIGAGVVQWMLENGMIVDLTHSTPAIRAEVFKMNEHYKRPLVFSHVGVQKNFIEGNYPNFKWYDVSDDEIKKIIDCKGVIGVIFENYWLTGCNSKMKGQDFDPKDFHKGINYIINTIQHIKEITDCYLGNNDHSYDFIAFGSDFDGLADSPSDLYTPRQLPNLVDALHDNGIKKEDIQKMTSGNVLRVLELGWT